MMEEVLDRDYSLWIDYSQRMNESRFHQRYISVVGAHDNGKQKKQGIP
jgi:hypothetical protein